MLFTPTFQPFINSAFYAFEQSDLFGKFIVLLLFAFSIFAWFLIFDKWVGLRKALNSTKKLQEKFSRTRSFLSMSSRKASEDCPLSKIYRSGSDHVSEVFSCSKEELTSYAVKQELPRQLTAIESETIRSSMERVVNSEIHNLEDRMGLLSTLVSVSPFFGLLGTVWGVMGAFIGMAQKGSANIGAIAPGISGALLTTVIGLVVAIPSLIGYNLLNNSIKSLTVTMDNFVEEFMANLTIHRVKK